MQGDICKGCCGLRGSPYGLAGHDPAGPGSVSAGPSWSYQQAMELLRIWEYTGRVRRGYFVEGMSGAQFIRKEEYEGITAVLKTPEDEVVWLNAWDPAQIWGKALEQPEGRDFLNVPREPQPASGQDALPRLWNVRARCCAYLRQRSWSRY